jgi:two-component system, LuxR family, sensor kinase FixL
VTNGASIPAARADVAHVAPSALAVGAAAAGATASFVWLLADRCEGDHSVVLLVFSITGALMSVLAAATVQLADRARRREAATAALNARLEEEARTSARATAALQESEARFRALLDGAPDGIVGVDPAGAIRFVNAEAERLFGYAHDELRGRKIETLVPEPLREGHVAKRDAYARMHVRRAMSGATGLKGRRKDGTEFDAEIALSPVETGEGRLVMSVVRDVTVRKAAERRESTMLHALARIGESAAVLAHEIKNPITAVNAALKAVGSRLGLEEREVLVDLVGRLRRVEAMIRRTLAFAKLIEPRRARVRASTLCDAALRDLAPLLAERAVVVARDVSDDPVVDVDPELLGEVLTNLVANAAEARDAGTRVVLKAARRGEGVDLVVEDDGPGLPPHARENLFRPFVTTKEKGTGLGLSICRKIVDAHGGAISFEDVVPHGVRVRIFLPETGDARPTHFGPVGVPPSA